MDRLLAATLPVCAVARLPAGHMTTRTCTHSSIPPHDDHSKATNPDRVYAGVVQQNNEGDVDCLYDYCRIIKEERNIEPKVRKEKRDRRSMDTPAFT